MPPDVLEHACTPIGTACTLTSVGHQVNSEPYRQARHLQVGAEHVRTKSARRKGYCTCKQGKYSRTERALSTSGFVDVNCVAACVCGNMHNEQNKSRAGELYLQGDCRPLPVAELPDH